MKKQKNATKPANSAVSVPPKLAKKEGPIMALFVALIVLTSLIPEPVVAVGGMLAFALMYMAYPNTEPKKEATVSPIPKELLEVISDQSKQISKVLEASALNSEALNFIVQYINTNSRPSK